MLFSIVRWALLINIMASLVLVAGADSCSAAEVSQSKLERSSARHFVVLVPSARVFSRKDQLSRVIFDLPCGWPIYVEETSDPKWLKVSAIGSEPYAMKISSKVIKASNTYSAENGYVLKSDLVLAAEMINALSTSINKYDNLRNYNKPISLSDSARKSKYEMLDNIFEHAETYNVYGMHDTAVLYALRAACLLHCDKYGFVDDRHLTMTFGDILPAKENDFSFGLSMFYGQGNGSTPLQLDEQSQIRFYLIGGDAFLVFRSDMVVVGIVRNIMMLQSIQDQYYNPLFCKNCYPSGLYYKYGSVQPTRQLRQALFKAETPITIPDAKVIMAPEMFRLQNTRRPVVITSVVYSFGLRDTIRLTNVGGPGSFYDSKQYELSNYLISATNGDKNRLIVVYGRAWNDWDAYNIVLRAERLGYKNISWMRMGLLGWISCGLPLSVTQ